MGSPNHLKKSQYIEIQYLIESSAKGFDSGFLGGESSRQKRYRVCRQEGNLMRCKYFGVEIFPENLRRLQKFE
jgi:hypothetical protein